MTKLIHQTVLLLTAFIMLPLAVLAQTGKAADIVADKTTGCAPEVITFQVTNPPIAKKFVWIINGDSIIGKDKQDYLFDSKGQYDISVVITDTSGQSVTITKKNLVTLNKADTNILLTISRAVLCNGVDSVSLTSKAKGIKRWDWIVDGTNYLNAGTSVVHRFLSTGNKDIVIRATDSSGCFAIKTFPSAIVVAVPPVLDFNADVTKGCIPLYVNIYAIIKKGSSAIASYQWALNGSNAASSASSGPLALHYDSAGSYNAALTIHTKDGCIYTNAKTDYIKAGKITRPTLDSAKKYGCPGTVFSFLNKTPIIGKTDFTWSFTGGDIQQGSNDSVQYVNYPKGGNYDVSVKSDYNGCVRSNTYPGLVHVDEILADFTADNMCNCKIPDTVNFNTVGKLSNVKNITYAWTFYDTDGKTVLGTSALASPRFIYHKYGSYSVKLKTGIAGGCFDSVIKKDMLVFKPLDSAMITMVRVMGCAGESFSPVLTMPDACPGVEYIYEWTFYDKDSHTILKVIKGKNPSMTYNDTGKYNVDVKIMTTGGCEVLKKFAKSVWILVPKPAYVADTLYGCMEGGITLRQTTTPADATLDYSWVLTNVADTNIVIKGTGDVYKPAFDVPGVYKVTFATIVGGKCRYVSPLIKYLNISGVRADFTTSDTNGCLPFSAMLTSKVLKNIHYGAASDSLKVQWTSNPDQGIVFSNPNATNSEVTITKAGCYDISLTITNSTGCTTTVLKKSLICSGILSDFNMPDRICLGDSLNVFSTSFNAVKYKWITTPTAPIHVSASGKSAAILFPASGKYLVKLVAYAPSGCTDTATKIARVERVKAEFTSKDTANACAPAYVSFTVIRNGADSFYWSFGDGTTLVTADTNIAHVYKVNSGGKNSGFDVSMLAKSNLGCTDVLVRKKYIRVLGPVPDFTMQNTTGCESLTVSFVNKSIFSPVTYLDYGDFSDIDSLKFGPHTYTVRDPKADFAVFKPRLLAKDASGCTAWAPVTDSIIVYRTPKANFSYSATKGCWPYPIQFTDSSANSSSYAWDFNNDGITDDTNRNPLVVLKPGTYHVKLTVSNRFGCSDIKAMAETITVYPNVTAKISTQSDTVCLGTQADLHCVVSQPALVKKYTWHVDGAILDSNVFSGPDIQYRFTTPGLHLVSVSLTTYSGCEVTVSMAPGIVVPDTLQKTGVSIHYVTVNRDSSIGISWEPSASPFFGKYELYRRALTGDILVYTTKNKTDTVYTDRTNIHVGVSSYTYYVKETDRCGRVATLSAPHTSILLKLNAVPQNKLQLKWTNYKGWASVRNYQVFRKNKEGFTLLATLGGTDTSYVDEDVCNDVYVYRIVAVDNTDLWTSESNSASGKPDYKYQTAGEDMVFATVTDEDEVNLAWTATAPRTESYIIDRYSVAEGWHNSYAQSKTNSWTDDKVLVNTAKYAYRVHVVSKCGDITGAGTIGTSILLKAVVKDDKVALIWTRYTFWAKGIDHYSIEIQQNNGNWNTIGNVSPDDTTYTDAEIHKGIFGQYQYRVIAIQAGNTGITSTSNKAAAILPSKVFIPNAFSPSGDGVNEIFKPVTIFIADNGMGVQYTFAIYNRWGEKLFETHNPEDGWDGTSKGSLVMEGVYIYTFDAIGYDRQQYHTKGSVTLLR